MGVILVILGKCNKMLLVLQKYRWEICVKVHIYIARSVRFVLESMQV